MSAAWQPIETAPKDGSAILVFSPGRAAEGVPPEQFVVRWMTALEDGEGNWIIYRQIGSDAFAIITRNPTHWMPVPEPPTQD